MQPVIGLEIIEGGVEDEAAGDIERAARPGEMHLAGGEAAIEQAAIDEEVTARAGVVRRIERAADGDVGPAADGCIDRAERGDARGAVRQVDQVDVGTEIGAEAAAIGDQDIHVVDRAGIVERSGEAGAVGEVNGAAAAAGAVHHGGGIDDAAGELVLRQGGTVGEGEVTDQRHAAQRASVEGWDHPL